MDFVDWLELEAIQTNFGQIAATKSENYVNERHAVEKLLNFLVHLFVLGRPN